MASPRTECVWSRDKASSTAFPFPRLFLEVATWAPVRLGYGLACLLCETAFSVRFIRTPILATERTVNGHLYLVHRPTVQMRYVSCLFLTP